jgi:hypothetical protein
MPAADLSSSAARNRNVEREATTEDPTKPFEVDSAFIIYKRKEDGRIVMTNNVNVPIIPEKACNEDDIYMMLTLVLKQINNSQIAQIAAQASMVGQQLAMQAQQQIVPT